MPAIAAHAVNKPRKPRTCVQCRDHIEGRHVVAYGYAERGDTPYRMRFCIACAWDSLDPKVWRASLSKGAAR